MSRTPRDRHPHPTRSRARIAVAALACGASVAVTLPSIAQAAPSPNPWGPSSLKITRTGADSSDLLIDWAAVARADHYTVNVFDGTKDTATVVAKDQTSVVFDGQGTCTRYQVRVSAAYPDGGVGRTGTYYVNSLAPGAVSKLTWAGTTLSWGAPKLPGEKPVTEYRVQVKKIATGEIVVDTSTPDTTLDVPVDAARTYTAKVTAVNDFGSCSTAATQIKGTDHDTTAPLGVRLRRDEATPTTVLVNWDAPEWANSEGITGYRIYYRTHGARQVHHVDVDANAREVSLDLDAAYNWDIQIKALGTRKHGKISKPVTLVKLGRNTRADVAVDPDITIKESGAKVVVDISSPLGSVARYANLDVRIAPTMGGAGFQDKALITNGSNQITFGEVPCGVYTVVVTGQGAATAKEFGRLYLNRCTQNVIPANAWKLVHGRAAISGNAVDFPYGGEARVISTLARRTGDMVFTTDATLGAGWGYGIWTRASFDSTGVSGYSFQYDPGYGRVSSFGPALLLRVWNGGRECGNPIAKVKWPAGLGINDRHHVVVVAQGDSLYASIDGQRLFEVASLKQALTDSRCGYTEPQGTQVGFRVWNAETRATFANTTLN